MSRIQILFDEIVSLVYDRFTREVTLLHTLALILRPDRFAVSREKWDDTRPNRVTRRFIALDRLYRDDIFHFISVSQRRAANISRANRYTHEMKRGRRHHYYDTLGKLSH